MTTDPRPVATAGRCGTRVRRRARGTLAAAGLLVCALTLAACGSSGDPATSATAATTATASCGSGAPRLTVQGSGVATGTPDLITLSMSVDVTDATAQQALADDNTRAGAVITALVAGGVAQKDIQTTGLSVQPNYTFTHGTEVLTGYAVDNSVVAKIRDLAHAGSIIDAASTAGGDAAQISTLAFSIEDPRPLQDRARIDAVTEAASHAAAMAVAAGERLGPVCSLTDQTTAPPPDLYNNSDQAAGTAAAPSAVPLEAGTQQASAQVSIVYSLGTDGAARA